MKHRFQLTGWPPSANSAWKQGRGKRWRSRDYEVWRKKAWAELTIQNLGDRLERGVPVSVHVRFHGSWTTPKGKIRRVDLDNRLKTLMDLLETFYKFDDSQVFELHAVKIDKSEKMTYGEIET